MVDQTIHIFFYPSVLGYSAYSAELDGIEATGKTLEELFSKIRHMINVRANTLEEIGKVQEAQQLKAREVVFLEK